MAISLTKIAKTIELDLSDVPSNLKSSAKKEVGEFVVNEILRSVSEGKSPVSGYSKFKTLNKKYADDEKGGDRNPNLELDGDMLDALVFKNASGDAIEVGIFQSSQVPKADGHNNFSGESRLPTRRFIPEEDENFKRDITNGINRILRDFKRVPSQTVNTELSTITTLREDETGIGISINDILSADFIDEFLNGGL